MESERANKKLVISSLGWTSLIVAAAPPVYPLAPCWNVAVIGPLAVDFELDEDERHEELLDDKLRLDELDDELRQLEDEELDDRQLEDELEEATAISPPPTSSMTVPISLVWTAMWPA